MPDPIEDLKKARWYIDREIEKAARGGKRKRSGIKKEGSKS